MKKTRFLTVLLVIAVMFTFSFSGAFAYVPYDKATTGTYISEAGDFFGYSASTTDKGTYGITEVERARLVYELNAEADKADGMFAAPAQAKVDAAFKTALDAVKAAKTNKEAMVAMDACKKVLKDNEAYTYYNLAAAFEGITVDEDWAFTVELDEAGNYCAPGYDYETTDGNGLLTVAEYETGKISIVSYAAFEYLMDQGLYGYTTPDAWVKAVTKAKDSVAKYMNPYWIGTKWIEAAVGNNSLYADLSKYGKTLYGEYTRLLKEVETFNNAYTVPTVDEVVTLIDKLEAFNDKYDLDNDFSITYDGSPEVYELDGKRVEMAAEEWNTANLDAATSALAKINTTSGYVAAKADILAAAKTLFATMDKYADYQDDWAFVYDDTNNVLVNNDDVAQIVKALEAIMIEDGDALTKAQAYTESIKTASGYDFDDSAENVAALENARKLFDAYFADYADAYAFVETYGSDLSISPSSAILENGELKNYEAKLLAGEYNKAKTAEYKGNTDKIEKNYVQAYLNNATVKVTTTALGNNKIRVQAKVDTASFEKILNSLEDGWTVSYKFYHKTAAGKTYKAAKEKNRNYITYTKLSLKKGVKYKFRCAVIVKDENGNVVATKDYKASTIGSRVCR